MLPLSTYFNDADVTKKTNKTYVTLTCTTDTHTHLQLEWDLPSRQWLAVTSILLITAAAGVAVPLALRVSAGAPLEERLEVAAQLLESVPLIDGHNDLPWNIRKFLHNKLNDFQ